MAHRDVYQPVERCNGDSSRDVLWEGGLRQSQLAEEDFDRYFNSNNECPSLETDDANIKRVQTGRPADASSCEDSSDPTGVDGNGFCDLGTDLHRCSVLPNLVVFGYSNLDTCMSWAGEDTGTPTFTSNSEAATVCRDGGAGSEALGIGTCAFGTDAANCGVRRFAFPADRAGPTVPDDSCLSARNGVCEDGLLFSKYAPGYNPCEPNTDLQDCGWRHSKRDALQGIAASDSCLRTPTVDCYDNSDLVGMASVSGTGRYSTCGMGTDTTRCKAKAETDLDGSGEGTAAYLQHRYRDKFIYVGAHEPGGCENTCVFPPNVASSWPDGEAVGDVSSVCSDGGEGSFRLPLSFPTGTATYHEFVCDYGTQCAACGERPKNRVRQIRDEIDQPTGPEFSECSSAPDAECCRAEHFFSVRGGDYCADTVTLDPTNCRLSEGKSSYFTTPTGCAGMCRLRYDREGNDDDCLPANPE